MENKSDMKITIDKILANIRVDVAIASFFKHLSRSQIQKHIKNGQIKVNSQNVKPSYILEENDVIITKIESSSGEIVKKTEDYVKKDEIIISGLVYNKETIVAKRCAEGKVYGEVWYKVKVSLPQSKIIKEKTNNKKWGIILKFNNNFVILL